MTVPAAHKIKCCNSLQRQEQSAGETRQEKGERNDSRIQEQRDRYLFDGQAAGERFPLVVAVPMEGIIEEKKARKQEDANPLCSGTGLFRERQHGECADYCE